MELVGVEVIDWRILERLDVTFGGSLCVEFAFSSLIRYNRYIPVSL